MTDEDLRKLLGIIRSLATWCYPFPEKGPRNDERLIWALGQIAGIATKALDETNRERVAG